MYRTKNEQNILWRLKLKKHQITRTKIRKSGTKIKNPNLQEKKYF